MCGYWRGGLDYFYEYASPKQQEIVFEHKLQSPAVWICQLSYMRVMRTRMWRLFAENEMERELFEGVLHCFSSGAELAKGPLKLGFISVFRYLTFNKAEELRCK